MKTYPLFLLLICLTLISCSTQEQIPLYPTLEPRFFEAEGMGMLPPIQSNLPNAVYFGSGMIHTQKGLTRAAKIQLERGQTSYFLLAFSTEYDKKNIREKLEPHDMKLIWHTRSYTMVRVKPSALSYLQQLTEEGTLKFGGPIPPRAKINRLRPVSLERRSPSDRVNVVVRLLTQNPTLEEKAEVATWLDIEEEINGWYRPLPLEPGKHEPYYLATGLNLTGLITVEHIPYLLEIPVVFDMGKPPSPLD